MTAAVELRARTSTTLVLDANDGAFSAARLLRMFDQARRELALDLFRDEGAGAGYDGLKVDWDAIAAVRSGDVVTVTAMRGVVVRAHGHHVDYVATATSGLERCVLLAHAHGWTLSGARRADAPKTCDSAKGEVRAG